LASGNAFGSPTSLPFGIHLWGAKRHPTQIYETLAAVVILGIFWPGRKRFLSWKPGEYFFSIAASAAAARLFLEALRADSVLTQNGFRLVQLAAWMILAICLLALIWINRTTKPAPGEQP
jgi:phosphatidylglycerol:prolipoprotein diacylglycerol transferase